MVKMSLSDYSLLRESCLSLVRAELKAKYSAELFDEYVALTLQHRMLPAVPLVEETYKGIIGYYNYLQQNSCDTTPFLQDALHDLAECLHFQRSDGYSPRTAGYVHFYGQEQE